MFIPLNLDDFRFLIDNYKFFTNNSDHYKSTYTIEDRKIESITSFDSEYQCFVTCSTEYKRVFGRGNTPKQSEMEFVKRMQKYIIGLSNRGRPKLGNKHIHCRIPSDLKDYLDSFCDQHNITQGQFIADMLYFHRSYTEKNS